MGGANAKDAARNLIDKIIPTNAQVGLNMKGTRSGKKPFAECELFNVFQGQLTKTNFGIKQFLLIIVYFNSRVMHTCAIDT